MTSKFQLVPVDIQDRLKELPGRAEGMAGLAALWLFGSMARGEATPVSDVDLAYLAERHYTGDKLERFETDLYMLIARTLHTDEFSLISLRSAPAYVVWKVLSDGRMLVSRIPAEVSAIEEAVYRSAPDVLWLRETGNQEFLRGVRMPEPKVDKERVTELLRLINEDMRVLQQKIAAKKDEYLASRDLQAIVERRLQTAAEGCITVGNHLLARLGLRAPQDYADVFQVLGDSGVLPRDLVRQMMDMARFRNLLVHVYWAIDHERVYDALQARLSTLEVFVQTVARWLGKPT
jgi:uncharacterized protein YutE (UPF0331/DUF86 family)/predicted nucleotidyltransferase